MGSDTPTSTRILVADDDLAFCELVAEWLTDSGYDVVTAGDGEEALAKLESHGPDIVVTDLRMPKMDGLTLLQRLKAWDATVEVIFLTGQATLNDAVEALREGRGFDLLQKPLVDFNRLNVVIDRALSRRGTTRPPVSDAKPNVSPLVDKALDFISERFDQGIQLKEVAEALGYSTSYLTDMTRRETGLTIQQWIIRHRLNAAEQLLQETDQPVGSIARRVGYDDVSYFVRQFRRHYGIPPQAWRERDR